MFEEGAKVICSHTDLYNVYGDKSVMLEVGCGLPYPVRFASGVFASSASKRPTRAITRPLSWQRLSRPYGV